MSTRILQIGLGTIGMAIAQNLSENGYEVVGFDVNQMVRNQAATRNIATYESLLDALESIPHTPKIIFLSIPAEHVTDLLHDILEYLNPGDIIADLSNSFFMNSVTHHQLCKDQEVHFVDCGISGGESGARNGASIMVGGEDEAVQLLEQVMQRIAIADGYAHVGGPGAGHFAKMVHNAIEYGMIGAIAEGFFVIQEHQAGLDLKIHDIFKPYTHGSIIQSQLITWLQKAYQADPTLRTMQQVVSPEKADMNMEYLSRHEEMKVLDAALIQRKLTRIEPSTIGTLINAMRSQFGGHAINNRNNEQSVKTLKFSPQQKEAIISGATSFTWRLFDEKNLQEGDEIVCLCDEVKKVFGIATIEKVTTTTLNQLTIPKPLLTIYKDHTELYKTFRHYYNDPTIDGSTEVKKIDFTFSSLSH